MPLPCSEAGEAYVVKAEGGRRGPKASSLLLPG